MTKKVAALGIIDFVDSPVWTWADAEDERLVVPLGCPDVLPDGHDALFVLGELVLSDGTRTEGVLCVRLRDRFVYLVCFPKGNHEFFDLPLHPRFGEKDPRGELAVWLGKPLDHVFPITYRTRHRFRDGQLLAGEIT